MTRLLSNRFQPRIAPSTNPATKPSYYFPLAFAILLSICCFGQSPTSASTNSTRRKVPATQPELAMSVRLPAPETIPDGFPVRLRLTKTLDPKKLKSGEEVPLVLASDLYFRNLLLAVKGLEVKAIVENAHGPRAFSRGSKLTIKVQSTTLLNGQNLRLRGNPGARGSVDESIAPLQAIEGVFGAAVFPPASIVSLLLLATPGTNRPLPENTVTTAFVDGAVSLDTASLSAKGIQPVASETARVMIVRGIRGNHLNTDLFCNGNPIAHLGTKRYLSLNLSAGWYRFSVKADHPNVLIYVVPGKTYNLLSDRSSIQEADLDEINLNTIGFSRSDRKRTFGGLMADSKPVDPQDLYGPGTCIPLAEEISVPVPML